MKQYRYQKLLDGQIRLLRAEEGAHAGDLRFSIETYFRDLAPKYVAISYSWGNGAANKRIYLDDLRHMVRPNLWWCLYYVRKHPQWLYFWVDFVCIDQHNVLERNEQVRTMDLTYINASTVAAWLGLEYHPSNWDRYEPMESFGCSWDAQMSIMEFANRPYWTRMWVVQELLLARSVHVVCGGYCLPWANFIDMLGLDVENESSSITAEDEQLAAMPFIISRDPNYEQSLYDLLLAYRRSGCKDARDKVYSVLSLLCAEEREAMRPFFPDYSLNADSFVILSLAHIQQYCKQQVSVRSNDLFEALGVVSHTRRQKLLAAAETIELSAEAEELPHGTLHILARQELSDLHRQGQPGITRVTSDMYEKAKQLLPAKRYIVDAFSFENWSSRLSTWLESTVFLPITNLPVGKSKKKYRERHADPLLSATGWVKVKTVNAELATEGEPDGPAKSPDSMDATAKPAARPAGQPKAERSLSEESNLLSEDQHQTTPQTDHSLEERSGSPSSNSGAGSVHFARDGIVVETSDGSVDSESVASSPGTRRLRLDDVD